MESKQYRLTRRIGSSGWRVLVTYGLMDVEFLGGGRVWKTQAEARTAAKAHAEKRGVKPIILT